MYMEDVPLLQNVFIVNIMFKCLENSEKIRAPDGTRIFSEFSKHLIYHVFVVSSLILCFPCFWQTRQV